MCPGVCLVAAQCRSSFMRVNGIVYWLTVNCAPSTPPPSLPLPKVGVALTVAAASSVGRDGLHFPPMRWALPIFSEFFALPEAMPAFCAHISGASFFFSFLHFTRNSPFSIHYLYHLYRARLCRKLYAPSNRDFTSLLMESM